jgi:TolA-binding protein
VSADDKAAAAWDDYVSQQQDEKIKELERQLNAANERIKQLEDARTVAAANSLANMLAYEDAVAKIKRLEEAGDALFELCDASPIQCELVDQIPQRLKAWEEAKEAKP